MTRSIIDLAVLPLHTAPVSTGRAKGASPDPQAFSAPAPVGGGGTEPEVIDLDAAAARVRADEAERKLRAHSLFLAEAEHRLKTSASVIMGWAATLEERWDDLEADERRHGITVIRRVAGELVERASGLLQVASAEMTVLDQPLATVDLGEVVAAALADLEAVAPRHRLVVSGSGPVRVVAVEARVHEVLEQLVENAGKYAPDGTTITVSVSVEPGVGVLAVADEGPGLPPDVDVFAAFQRGPQTGGVSGAGIGLYLVRTRITALGGSVTAGTSPRGGALFTVRLPAAVERAPQATAAPPGAR